MVTKMGIKYDEKSYIFPQYISNNDITISVKGQMRAFEKEAYAYDNYTGEKVDFIDGKGYIAEDGSIWIYREKPPVYSKNRYPCFWLDENKKKIFSTPSMKVRSAFHESRLISLDYESLKNKSDANKVYYNEKEQDDIDNASAVYRPVIKIDDDFLKMIVKSVILAKSTNINRYKHATEKTYSVANMRAALRGDTKMSVTYFIIWAELLGFDYTITVMDNGTDPNDPLYTPLVYRSWKNNIKTLKEIEDEENEKKRRKMGD